MLNREGIRGRDRRAGVGEGWEKERRNIFAERGWTMEKVGKLMEERKERISEKLVKRVKERQMGGGRREKMSKSKFNKWHGMMKGQRLPGYLRKGWGRVDGRGWRSFQIIQICLKILENSNHLKNMYISD